jgi:hypothetical protein
VPALTAMDPIQSRKASLLLIAVFVIVPFVHNLGVFAKLFSEAVEAADLRPVEGIRVTGATCVQEVVFGVIRRCRRFGVRSRFTGWRPMCVWPPRSASLGPAASVRRTMKAHAVSNTPTRLRRSSPSWSGDRRHGKYWDCVGAGRRNQSGATLKKLGPGAV